MSSQSRPSIFAPVAASVQPSPAKEAGAPAVVESDMMRTSLYLSRAVHDKLREIAFTERRKVHELFVEGIDKVLAERGFPSTSELKNNIKAL